MIFLDVLRGWSLLVFYFYLYRRLGTILGTRCPIIRINRGNGQIRIDIDEYGRTQKYTDNYGWNEYDYDGVLLR